MLVMLLRWALLLFCLAFWFFVLRMCYKIAVILMDKPIVYLNP